MGLYIISYSFDIILNCYKLKPGPVNLVEHTEM